MLIWVVSLLFFFFLLLFAVGQQTLFCYRLIVEPGAPCQKKEPGALFGASCGKEEENGVMFH
jgi:hypothetical protein